jgi:hypothetical protein
MPLHVKYATIQFGCVSRVAGQDVLGPRIVRDARQSFERLSVHSVVLAKRSSDVLASILMLPLHTS